MSTYSSSLEVFKHRYNILKCIKCRFERNSARCGAAVSVTRGLFSKDGHKNINRLYFIECIFRSNVVIFKSINVAGNKDGTVFISEVQVTFGRTTDFTGNNGTALYLGSTGYLKSIAMFNTGSRVYFRRNSGYKGGAIVLSGNSALYIHSDYSAGDDYSSFYFLNNTATMFSGAISALTSILEPNIKYFEKSCFLLGRHGSVSLCRVERENKMAATYNVLAFKRRYFAW